MQGDRDAVYERVICKEARKQVGIGNQEKTSAENQEKTSGHRESTKRRISGQGEDLYVGSRAHNLLELKSHIRKGDNSIDYL